MSFPLALVLSYAYFLLMAERYVPLVTSMSPCPDSRAQQFFPITNALQNYNTFQLQGLLLYNLLSVLVARSLRRIHFDLLGQLNNWFQQNNFMSRSLDKKSVQSLLRETVQVQEFPEGRLVYVIADKESNTGMFNNGRLLVFNGKEKTIGYSNTFPKQVPFGSFQDIRYIKKKAPIVDVVVKKRRDKLNSIEIKCKEYTYRNSKTQKKDDWVFIFKSAKVADEAFTMLTQSIQVSLGSMPTAQKTVTKNPVQDPRIGNSLIKPQDQSNNKLVTQNKLGSNNYAIKQEVLVQAVTPNNSNPPAYKDTDHPNILQSKPSEGQEVYKHQGKYNYQPQPPFVSKYNYQPQPPSVDMQRGSSYQPSPIKNEETNFNWPQYNQPDKPFNQSQVLHQPKPTFFQIQDIRPQFPAPNSTVPQVGLQSNSRTDGFRYTHNQKHSSNRQFDLDHDEPRIENSRARPQHNPNLPSTRINLSDIARFRNNQQQNQPQHPRQGDQYNNLKKLNNSMGFDSQVAPPSFPQVVGHTEQPYTYKPKTHLQNLALDPMPQHSSNAFQLLKSPRSKPQTIMNASRSGQLQRGINASRLFANKPVEPSYEQIRIGSSKVRTPQGRSMVDSQTRNPSTSKQSSVLPRWNMDLYQSVNPFQVVNKFREASAILVRNIIDSFIGDRDAFTPATIGQTTTVYQQLNMVVIMGFSLYHQAEVEDTNRMLFEQFQNYKFVGQFVKNKDRLRVPLVNFIKYRGISALAKAVASGEECNKSQLAGQLARLEQASHISKEDLVNNCNFRKESSRGIVFIDDIASLVPIEEGVQLCPQLLKNYHSVEHLRTGKPSRNQLISFRNKELSKFLTDFQNLQNIVLGTEDLEYELFRYGLNEQSLGTLYSKAKTTFSRSVFASQMVARVATTLLSAHLQNQVRILSKKNPNNPDKLLTSFATEFTNDVFSRTDNSEELWGILISSVKQKFRCKVSREDIAWGYLLGAYVLKSDLKFNLRLLDKTVALGQQPSCISPHMIQGFLCKFSTTQLEKSDQVIAINSVLGNQPTEEGHKKIKGILGNPAFLQYLRQDNAFKRILVYIANFVSPNTNSSRDFVNPYDHIQLEPSSLGSARLQFMKIKWCLKHRDQEAGISILEESCELISFWGSEFHPLLSEFYDLFSAYYLMANQWDEALTLAKSSLVNTIKVVGTSAMPTGEKYFQLGNVLFNTQKNQDALTHYSKARDILANNGLINSPEFGTIELKVANLYLFFGKLPQAQTSATHAFNISEESCNEYSLMECFQLLSRIYEIQQNPKQLRQNALLCASKFNSSENEELFSRMLRISLYPFLVQLPDLKRGRLLQFCESIQFNSSKTEYYTWLFRKANKENITEKFINCFSKIDPLEPTKGYSTMGGSRRLDAKPEPRDQEFTTLLQAILAVVDPSFVVGILREFEY